MRSALWLCALAIGGCAWPKSAVVSPVLDPVPITVSRDVAHRQAAADVKEGYRRALEARGLRIASESATELTARPGDDFSDDQVRVVITPADTLTRVSISYRYRTMGSVFYHYPFHLPQVVSWQLDSTRRFISIPQRVVPETFAACPDVVPDTTHRIVNPAVIGGPAAVALRTQYTEEARTAGVEGAVFLAVTVSEHGRVMCIEVLSGLPMGLTESAVSAMRATTFTPAQQRGRPITLRVIQPVWFRLIE